MSINQDVPTTTTTTLTNVIENKKINNEKILEPHNITELFIDNSHSSSFYTKSSSIFAGTIDDEKKKSLQNINIPLICIGSVVDECNTKENSMNVPMSIINQKFDLIGNMRRSVNDVNYSNLKIKRDKNLKINDKRVVINVSGVRFETYSNTLKLIPESRLANLSETNSDYDPIKNEYFFDRHPGAFIAILNFFRTGKLHAPTDVCVNLFSEELNFWGISELSIEPCCWSAFSSQRDADEKLRKIMINDELEAVEELPGAENDLESQIPQRNIIQRLRRLPTKLIKCCSIKKFKSFYRLIRPKVWRFLDDRNSSTSANLFFWVAVIILFISLINFILETSSNFRVPYDIANNASIPRYEREEKTQPHPVLRSIEIFCNSFFTVELILRFLSSPNKKRFLCGPYNILEFLAILPIFFPTESVNNLATKSWFAKVHNYLEVFYILRILRIFVLVPKYSGLRVLLLTLKTSIGELFLYMMLLLMTLMIFATFEFYAEQIYEVDKNQFESILVSLWWAIVTMTTLGYGDIVPSTALGRIVGALCALCGLVFLALPIPVIVNNFTTFYAQAKGYQKLKAYLNERKGLLNRVMALHFYNSPPDTLINSIRNENDENEKFLNENSDKKLNKQNYNLQINNSNNVLVQNLDDQRGDSKLPFLIHKKSRNRFSKLESKIMNDQLNYKSRLKKKIRKYRRNAIIKIF